MENFNNGNFTNEQINEAQAKWDSLETGFDPNPDNYTGDSNANLKTTATYDSEAQKNIAEQSFNKEDEEVAEIKYNELYGDIHNDPNIPKVDNVANQPQSFSKEDEEVAEIKYNELYGDINNDKDENRNEIQEEIRESKSQISEEEPINTTISAEANQQEIQSPEKTSEKESDNNPYSIPPEILDFIKDIDYGDDEEAEREDLETVKKLEDTFEAMTPTRKVNLFKQLSGALARMGNFIKTALIGKEYDDVDNSAASEAETDSKDYVEEAIKQSENNIKEMEQTATAIDEDLARRQENEKKEELNKEFGEGSDYYMISDPHDMRQLFQYDNGIVKGKTEDFNKTATWFNSLTPEQQEKVREEAKSNPYTLASRYVKYLNDQNKQEQAA